MTTQFCWRLNPTADLHQTVEAMARAEARKVSQMLFVLVKEAVAARQATNHRFDQIVDVLKKRM
jgi:hypothetical protein